MSSGMEEPVRSTAPPLPPEWLRGHSPHLGDSALQAKLGAISNAFNIDLSNASFPEATQYTAPADAPHIHPNSGEFLGPLDENGRPTTIPGDSFAFGSDDEEEEDAEANDEWDHFLQEGRDNAKEKCENPTPVPLEIAIVAQKLCIDFRKQWKEPSYPQLLPKVIAANEEIRSITPRLGHSVSVPLTNGETGTSSEKYIINGRGISESINLVRESILGWSVALTDKARIFFANMVACESIALVSSLDKCGLNWKSIIDPEIRGCLEFVIHEGASNLEPEHLQALLALQARDEEACCFQTSHVENVKEPFKQLHDAMKTNNRALAQEKFQEIAAINRRLEELNASVGFKRDNRLLSMDYVEKGMNGVLNYNEQRERTEEQRHRVAHQFAEMMGRALRIAGYRDPAEFLLKLGGGIELRDNQKAILRKQSQRAIAYKEPVAIEATPAAPDLGPEADPMDTDTAEGQNGNPLFVGQSENVTKPDSRTTPAVGVSGASGVANGAGLRVMEIPGPAAFGECITSVGKVIATQRVGGMGGFRAIVNVCTENMPVYQFMPGANLGEFGMDDAPALHPPQNIKQRKRSDVKALKAMVEVKQRTFPAKRDPITKFLVEWNSPEGLEEWVNRSDLIRICRGKPWVEQCRNRLKSALDHNLEYLERMDEEDQNPETGQPLKKEDRLTTPWLFSDNAMSLSNRVERGEHARNDNADVNHILVNDQRLGQSPKTNGAIAFTGQSGGSAGANSSARAGGNPLTSQAVNSGPTASGAVNTSAVQ